MNSKYAGSMGFQRLLKAIKSAGGGPPGPDTVGTSQIIDGTIEGSDLNGELGAAIIGQVGVFEVTNTTGSFFTVTMSDDNGNDIFTDVFVDSGTTEYIHYVLPPNFRTFTYELTTSNGIGNYQSNYPSHNGMINHVLSSNIISFNIQRSHQNYLQVSIDP